MSHINPLAGLIANYGDSDDDSMEENTEKSHGTTHATNGVPQTNSPAVHPAPVPHCPWSACYDDNTGHTYYWNQQTNEVTWEAPAEYLLALKLAKQQLNTSGTTEVSAKEWKMYQQALAEKQVLQKARVKLCVEKSDKPQQKATQRKPKKNLKRHTSNDDDEKIELITSYYNSDSESNDETEKPVITVPAEKSEKPAKVPHKKFKTKPEVVEYGPSLPSDQSYSMPIGPELPPEYASEPKKPETEPKISIKDLEDSQDEGALLKALKDKAKLLEKLGGEIPKEAQKFISTQNNPIDTNIDDLLEEIEKKELPKVKKAKVNTDIFTSQDSNSVSEVIFEENSETEAKTPPLNQEFKPLFPSSKSIVESDFEKPTNVIEIDDTEVKTESESEKKNVYLSNSTKEELSSKKKLRISKSVLPERKKSEVPSYTTKYSQYIEGVTSERTGLGFSKDEDDNSRSPKAPVNYGNGIAFTKGEVLNENQKDENLDDLTDLVEAKLKFLNEQQLSLVAPVQEMLIQLQTLVCAFRAGALSGAYWRRWAEQAASTLAQHEDNAAPPGWTCIFHRAEAKYGYKRDADGFHQWEYPAVAHTDMEICTTPPPGEEAEYAQDVKSPPLPDESPARRTPPPPGTDSAPPTPPTPPPPKIQEPAKELGDELASFYSDIAQLEVPLPPSPAPPISAPPMPPIAAPPSPDTPPPPPPPDIKEGRGRESTKSSKKKSKMKVSSSIGMKHKTVSSMVAKWQQVAEEINSD